MLGLLLAFAFMIEALFDPGVDRRPVFTNWALFIAAAWLVALINPDFLAGVLFPIHMIRMHSLAWIGEWAPADFSSFQPLELLILGGLALGFSGKVILPPIRLLILLALVHAALAHARNQQLLGIVGALILAEPFGKALGQGKAHPLGSASRLLAGATVLVAVAGLVIRFML